MTDKTTYFLKHEYIPLLRKLEPGMQPKWGKMDAQQMVEHMRDIFKLANGKFTVPLFNTDPEKLASARSFLLSDHPFPRSVRVPVVPEEPKPHKYADLDEAIAKLEPEIEAVFDFYSDHPTATLVHPVFGDLDYELQLRYLEKHAYHHLRQFGIID